MEKKLRFMLLILGMLAMPSTMMAVKDKWSTNGSANNIGYCLDSSAKEAWVSWYDETQKASTVTIPAYFSDYKVVGIAPKAFENANIDTLIIQGNITKIEDDAFYAFANLKVVIFQGDATNAPIEMGCASDSKNALFSPCSNLTSVTLNRNVKYTDYSAKAPFEGLSKLSWVDIGSDVDSISVNCFRSTGVQNVVFSPMGRLQEIRSGAFSSCANLKNITFPICALPSNRVTIMDGAFTSSALYSITTTGYTGIRTDAFKSCTSLKVACFGGAAYVAKNAFSGCSALEEVHFEGDSLLILADESFSGNTAIKSVTVNRAKAPDDLFDGAETAFSQTTYNSATFQNFADDVFNNVDLSKTTPWMYFKNVKQSPNATLDINNPESMLGTEFNNIKMPYTIKKGQCELLCLPFDIDSYYFGSDAAIYTMSEDSIHHVSKTLKSNCITDISVYYKKLDIDKTDIIPACTPFLVTSERDDSLIQAPINLFQTNKVKFTSRDSVYTWYGDHRLESWNNKQNISTSDDQRFIVIDGCLKRINSNNYYLPAYTPVLYASSEGGSVYSPHYMDGSKADSVTFILRDSIVTTPHIYLNGYTTFYSSESSFEIPTEDYPGSVFPEVCTITGIDDDGQLTLSYVDDGIINKGQAVLITSGWKGAGKPIRLRMVTNNSLDTDAYKNNILKGVDADTPVKDVCTAGRSYVFVLSAVEGTGVAFFRYSSGKTLPAHKAYLDPSDLGSSSQAKYVTFFDTATGVSSIVPDVNEKSDDATYDLTGRKVSGNLKSGIYIKNNRKEIVR